MTPEQKEAVRKLRFRYLKEYEEAELRVRVLLSKLEVIDEVEQLERLAEQSPAESKLEAPAGKP